MFLFQERCRRDIFQGQTVALQTLALFMRINPIARRTQRESAFDQARDEDSPKAQPTHVGCLKHAQAPHIRRAEHLRLRAEATTYLCNERPELSCLPFFSLTTEVRSDLNALNSRHKSAPQGFEAIEVEHGLRQFPVFNRASDGPGDLLAKAELIQQPDQRKTQLGWLAFSGN